MSDEVFSMTICPEEGEPFLRRLHPVQVFERDGERWAVAECWEGYWVTHVGTGFRLTPFFDTVLGAYCEAIRILEAVTPERYIERMAIAKEARSKAEVRGFIEEINIEDIP